MPRKILKMGYARQLKPEILLRWREVWLRAGGPQMHVPLAAFIRRPDLLVDGPDDPALIPPSLRRPDE